MTKLFIKRITKYNKNLIYDLFQQIGKTRITPNKKFFEDDNNILLVAFWGNMPCGFLYGYCFEQLHQDKKEMFLYSLDVFEEYRRKGIATKLIHSLLLVGKKNNCKEIFVVPYFNNKPAINLYKKTGGKIESKNVIFIYKN